MVDLDDIFINSDLALFNRLSTCTIDNKKIPVAFSEQFIELANKNKYPAIKIDRLNKTFDRSRHSNDVNLYGYDDPENPTSVYVADSPIPFNIVYQVELLARKQYEIDIMELWLAKTINPVGDYLLVERTRLDGSVEENNHNINLDLYTVNDEEKDVKGQRLYRRIFTYSVEVEIEKEGVLTPLALELEFHKDKIN